MYPGYYIMTFPDAEDKVSQMAPMDSSVNIALKTTLIQAQSGGRLTVGAYECAKLLEAAPDSVMLCLLPVASGTQDVSVYIQHTLIEAFCWENEIAMFKVDCCKKLANLLSDVAEETLNDNNNGGVQPRGKSPEIHCVLVQSSAEESSTADKTVCDYYNKLMSNNALPFPIVDLPA